MPIIRVNNWIPDAGEFQNPGMIDARNCVPGLTSYQPFGQYSILSGAIDAYARGAIEVIDEDGNVVALCGDGTKLYKLSSTTWNNVSQAGNYTLGTEESWEMVLWKNKVLATGFSEVPQQFELGGALFSDLTTDLRAYHIAVIGNHVFFANTWDSTDGNVPTRIRWSAFDDETDYTVSAVTGADFRDTNRGPIQRLYGGEYGIALGRETTFRIDQVGAPTWFAIRETLPGIGTIAPGASSRLGEFIYSWSNQGFVAIRAATGYAPIGDGIVDKYAIDDLDDTNLFRMSCVADPVSGRVFWAYPGQGNLSGNPNRLICYDTGLQKWSIIDQEVELLWRASGIGFTLEQLDTFSASLDDLAVSLDSSQWKGGGKSLLAAFDIDHKHGFFSGTPRTGTLELAEGELHPGHQAQLNSFRALVDGGSVTAQIGTRNKLTDDVSWSPVLSPTSTGRFTYRANARYHRFRVFPAGDWRHVHGVQVERDDVRRGGIRGRTD